MEDTTRRAGVVSRLAPLLVFTALLAGTLAAFVVTRQVINDQEERLLAERADEVAALLENAIGGIEASLRLLGSVASSPDPAAVRLFSESAATLVEGNNRTVGLAVAGDGGFEVAAAVGDGPGAGDTLTGPRAALVERAVTTGELVSELVDDAAERRLVLAVPVDGAVAYQESAISTEPSPSTPDSPFRELRVALYASPDADPTRLVVTTEDDLPLAGRVQHMPFSVGADQWLLAVGARDALVGSFARNVPWMLLAGGVVGALLAAAVLAVLARRRTYALALVDERTSELRAANEALSEIRAFQERLLTAAPVVVRRITMPDRRSSYVSPNIERLFGVTEAEALTPGLLGSLVEPEDQVAFDAAIDSVANEHSEFETLEYRLRRGEGMSRWVSATFVPETDDSGDVVAVLCYIVDIDDRRRAENARREAQQAAYAANMAKTEFLSRMSHELRTPLNAVLGFGQLLALDQLTGHQHDAVDHILKAGRHLLDLINEVLDISRVESGDLALSPEAVRASELVDEAVDLVRLAADERSVQLVVDSSSCDAYVYADRQRTKQVILNLLSNAVKYNRPRGTVAVSCQQPGDNTVRIDVADTGVGIPTERLGLLFTPFERLGAEHTGEEGTGIGLALSRRLAEAMGGRIEVTSTLGQGSTFSVELPRVEGPVERYERLNGGAPAATAPQAPRYTVLHIEDNLSNLKLVERILAHRADVEVVAAMQGRLGLELARQHRPALVLLDLHLPDIGGDQVLQRLRDDPSTASIPVIMVSADASAGQVRRLLTAGAAGYLTKPIDVAELLRLLDEALADP